MKSWPPENKPAAFEQLVQPFTDILHQWYGNKYPNRYVGALGFPGDVVGAEPLDTSNCLNIGSRELTGSFDTAYALSPEGLAYHQEHDRDLLDVVAMLLVQCGLEQGRRLLKEDIAVWVRLGRASLNTGHPNSIKMALDNLLLALE